MIRRVLSTAFFVLIATIAHAQGTAPSAPDCVGHTCYYVDATTGDDTRTSTQAKSQSTPWQHAPGMACATSNASSFAASADTYIILKGGETWGNSCFQWTLSHGGTTGHPVVFTSDPAWFTGASWTRPILDLEDLQAASGASNNIIQVSASNVTFAWMEIIRFHFVSGLGDAGNGGNTIVHPGVVSGMTIEDLYIHAWQIGTGSVATNGSPGIFGLVNSGSGNGTSEIAYNIIDGSDSDEVLLDPDCTGNCYGSMLAFWGGVQNGIHHNYIEAVCQGFVGVGTLYYNNVVNDLRKGNGCGHTNAWESNTDQTGGAKFYNNVFTDVHNAVNVWIAPRSGDTSYVFNNVVYQNHGISGNNLDPASAVTNPGGSVVVVNNTWQGESDASDSSAIVGGCSGTAGALAHCTYINNVAITSAASPWSVSCNAGTNVGSNSNITATSNLCQSTASWNSAGYTSGSTFAFAPTVITGPTVGAGTDLTATYCGTIPALCSDTSYGVTINSTTHTVDAPRTPLARPNGSAWDIGAYQYQAAATTTGKPLRNLIIRGDWALLGAILPIGWRLRRRRKYF